MPELPVIPKGFITNFPGSIKSVWVGHKQFIFLLSWVALFVLISFFVLDFSLSKADKVLNTPSINYVEINFPSNSWRDSVLNHAEAASTETDDNKRFEHYQKIFTILVSVYTTDHDSNARVQAEKLAKFISQDTPSLYKANNFTIPCLDLECGQPNYPEEISQMIKTLSGVDSVDSEVLDGIFKNLEAAALSPESSSQFSYYFNAFNSIIAEKKAISDENLTEIAQKLRNFLERTYPNNFSLTEKFNSEAFEI